MTWILFHYLLTFESPHDDLINTGYNTTTDYFRSQASQINSYETPWQVVSFSGRQNDHEFEDDQINVMVIHFEIWLVSCLAPPPLRQLSVANFQNSAHKNFRQRQAPSGPSTWPASIFPSSLLRHSLWSMNHCLSFRRSAILITKYKRNNSVEFRHSNPMSLIMAQFIT